MNIIYFLNSIDYKGGIERVIINKANYFAENGHSVSIAVTDQKKNNDYIQPLSQKVKLIKLNVNYYSNETNRFFTIIKYIKHLIRIFKCIKSEKPDVVFSVGQCEKYLLPLIPTKAKKIRENADFPLFFEVFFCVFGVLFKNYQKIACSRIARQNEKCAYHIFFCCVETVVYFEQGAYLATRANPLGKRDTKLDNV